MLTDNDVLNIQLEARRFPEIEPRVEALIAHRADVWEEVDRLERDLDTIYKAVGEARDMLTLPDPSLKEIEGILARVSWIIEEAGLCDA